MSQAKYPSPATTPPSTVSKANKILAHTSMTAIETYSLPLNLPDPSLPLFHASLTLLRGSLFLSVGPSRGDGQPYALAVTFYSLQQGARPSATSLSPAGGAASAYAPVLSAKLAKRYQRQVFLSLDLAGATPQGETVAGSGDRVLLLLEKALVVALDKVLR